MIGDDKMKEAFRSYVEQYDLHNPKILQKYQHSLRVMKLSKKYATLLGWSNEDIELATLIGLLHDFGRFEQLAVYHSYDDLTTIDHADYSVEQLFTNHQIVRFPVDPKDYPLVRAAIQNHNKLMIHQVTYPRILQHCQLIRDVDKLDILYNSICRNHHISTQTVYAPISEVVMDTVRQHRTVDKKDFHNKNDILCCRMSFVFDLNYDICLPLMKQYLDQLYESLEYQERFTEVFQIINQYIEERMNNNVR